MAIDYVARVPRPDTSRWDSALREGAGFALRYVPALDMLAVLLGGPVASYSYDGEDGVMIRISLDGNMLSGVEIYDCSDQFLPAHPEARAAYEQAIGSHQTSGMLGQWGCPPTPDSPVAYAIAVAADPIVRRALEELAPL